jgi:hypothetical protein
VENSNPKNVKSKLSPNVRKFTQSGHPGPNPTTSIYSASVVYFYNAAGSLACFENKNILFYFENGSGLLQRWRCSCKFKSRWIGSWFSQPLEGMKIFREKEDVVNN